MIGKGFSDSGDNEVIMLLISFTQTEELVLPSKSEMTENQTEVLRRMQVGDLQDLQEDEEVEGQ